MFSTSPQAGHFSGVQHGEPQSAVDENNRLHPIESATRGPSQMAATKGWAPSSSPYDDTRLPVPISQLMLLPQSQPPQFVRGSFVQGLQLPPIHYHAPIHEPPHAAQSPDAFRNVFAAAPPKFSGIPLADEGNGQAGSFFRRPPCTPRSTQACDKCRERKTKVWLIYVLIFFDLLTCRWFSALAISLSANAASPAALSASTRLPGHVAPVQRQPRVVALNVHRSVKHNQTTNPTHTSPLLPFPCKDGPPHTLLLSIHTYLSTRPSHLYHASQFPASHNLSFSSTTQISLQSTRNSRMRLAPYTTREARNSNQHPQLSTPSCVA